MKKFWKMIKNQAKNSAEILIYEMIGKDWWSDEGIAAKDFAADLKSLGNVTEITLRINSAGGSVFEGITMYNLLKAHPANITCYIDGIAASIASVIAMAANKIIMPENAMMMIHDPWGFAQGNSEEMRKMAEMLDKIKEAIATSYNRTACTEEEIAQMMTDETWLTAADAIEKGFADETVAAVKVAAGFDLSKFRNAPPALRNINNSTPDIIVQANHKEEVKMEKCTVCGAVMADGKCPHCMAKAQARLDHAANAKEIKALATKFNQQDLALDYIEQGKSAEEFKDAILAKMSAGGGGQIIDSTANLMTGKEARQYSYARAMLAATNIRLGIQDNCLESEVSAELAKRVPVNMVQHGGFFVPLVKNAGLDSHTTNAGSEFVFTQYGGEIIEALRNMSVCSTLGSRILTGLSAPIGFPKVTSEGAATWVAENPGSDASDTDDATDIVTISPKGLTRSSSISRMLLTTGAGDGDAMIRNSISAALALAIDRAGIHGSGASNQPTGIYAASGVNAKAMGGVPTFGKLIDMITEVAKDNAIMGSLGWACTPGMAGKLLQTLVASAAGSSMIFTGKITDGMIGGYRAIASNQVSSVMTGSTTTGGSEHGIVFGNWSDLLIGIFGGLEILVDPFAKKKQGMIEYTLYGMADVQLRHGESFCKSTGATIA